MTLGQVAYERRYRRDQEAPVWNTLPEAIKRTWENTAQAVADVVRNGGQP